MPKKMFHVLVYITAFIFLAAMAGSSGFEKAPKVDKNYAVVITDKSGNKIEGTNFSCEGKLYFAGQVGMAQALIPFDKARELSVGEVSENSAKAAISLANNSQTILKIDAKTKCHGEANFGSFMLLIKEINKIVFK